MRMLWVDLGDSDHFCEVDAVSFLSSRCRVGDDCAVSGRACRRPLVSRGREGADDAGSFGNSLEIYGCTERNVDRIARD